MTTTSPDSTSSNCGKRCKLRIILLPSVMERNQHRLLFFLFLVLRKGYEAASKDFDPQELDVSVVGRSFMITGANSGIGRATAMAVAKQGRSQVHSGCDLKKILILLCSFSGGTVHMVCRNRERAEEARECIINDSGNTVSVPLRRESDGTLPPDY